MSQNITFCISVILLSKLTTHPGKQHGNVVSSLLCICCIVLRVKYRGNIVSITPWIFCVHPGKHHGNVVSLSLCMDCVVLLVKYRGNIVSITPWIFCVGWLIFKQYYLDIPYPAHTFIPMIDKVILLKY